MKSFLEFYTDSELSTLSEGIIRKGALAVYAARSKTNGDKAVRAFDDGLALLRKSRSAGVEDSERWAHLDSVLEKLILGLIHLRFQNGDITGLNFVGHSLRHKERER